MTKDEMLSRLYEGAIVHHNSFTCNEWMKQYSNTQYIFEDGCICDAGDFWRWRIDCRWLTGWSVVDDI